MLEYLSLCTNWFWGCEFERLNIALRAYDVSDRRIDINICMFWCLVSFHHVQLDQLYSRTQLATHSVFIFFSPISHYDCLANGSFGWLAG